MFELLALQIYAESGLLALMIFGVVVYFIFKFFNNNSSGTTKTTDNGQGSNNSSQVSTVKRHYEGYVEHGDTIPVKLFGVRDKKNRPNRIDCYDERWDDNTGHVHQLFTFEKPLVDFEPKYIETNSIHIEDHNEHIGMMISQYAKFIMNKPNTLKDYMIQNLIPIQVDSSVKQDKGWMVTFAMIAVDCKDDITCAPIYDLTINNKVYLHGKYKTEMVCAAYEIFKKYYISVIKNDTDELTNNLITTLWFFFEHSDEDYFDFVKRYNFDSKYIDVTKEISPGISKMFNSDADLILKYWNDSNIQKADIYYYGTDHMVSSNEDIEVRYYAIVREVPLTH